MIDLIIKHWSLVWKILVAAFLVGGAYAKLQSHDIQIGELKTDVKNHSNFIARQEEVNKTIDKMDKKLDRLLLRR